MLPLRTLLKILRRFQLADPVVRQRGEHVRFESKMWQRAWPAVKLLFDVYLLSLSFLDSPGKDAVARAAVADGGGVSAKKAAHAGEGRLENAGRGAPGAGEGNRSSSAGDKVE